MNSTNKTTLVLILGFSLLVAACRDSSKSSSVMFVDQSEAFSVGSTDQQPNPLMLVVEINGEGKLSLNRIETGAIDDTTVLSEKLMTVFKDREKSSISEREVLIEMDGAVKRDALEKLIDALESVSASPIKVIRK